MRTEPVVLRCRVRSRDWIGEWWTPYPGEIVRLRQGEWLEWEEA